MELNLSQGFPDDFSKLTESQKQQIIDWELSLYTDKEPSINYISDNLYIGNYPAALNKNILDKNKITHILIAGKNMLDLYKDQITYKILPLYDSPYLKLKKYFNETNLFIENSIIDNKESNNVLIHCGAGVSRSVSFAIAYYIAKKGMTYEDALKHVKSKRKIANPNDGFEKELRDYSYEIHKRF